MNDDKTEAFREKLDQYYAWPSLYMFKFIVPADKVTDVKKLFPQHSVDVRPSKNGKYMSITLQMMMPSSQAVVDVYKTAAQVQGLIAL